MKLSTKGIYGLRAFIDIAIASEKEPESLSNVALRLNLSISYLEQLMRKLKKAGLITSSRGANGGYEITKTDHRVSVGDVLRALEGDLNVVNCVGMKEGHTVNVADCGVNGGCVSQTVWKKINDSVNNTVDNIFIDELVKESKIRRKEGKGNE